MGCVPGGHWKRLTLLGALAADGLVAAMTVVAATTTQVFLAVVQQALLHALRTRPGWVAVMDNLAPHKAASVQAAFQVAGVACPAASTNSTPNCPVPPPQSPPAMPKVGANTQATAQTETQSALAEALRVVREDRRCAVLNVWLPHH